MTKSKKRYSSEFKQEAIKLALQSPSVSGTTEKLGIPSATLHSWVTQSKKNGEHGLTNTSDIINHVNVREVMEENKRLHQKLARLEQEKAILKKVATYFAKELG